MLRQSLGIAVPVGIDARQRLRIVKRRIVPRDATVVMKAKNLSFGVGKVLNLHQRAALAHDEVDVAMVIKTLTQNASNAQNMIKEVIKTFKNFSADKDPANDCLNTAIITEPKLRTKKTIKKLKYIAGRILNKK